MDEAIDKMALHVREPEEKARALTLRVSALGVQGKLDQAIDLGIEVLEDLGETFPRRPGVLRIVCGLCQVQRTLKRFSDDDLFAFPLMTDPCKSAAMRLMDIIFPYVVNARHRLAPLLAYRMV